MVVTIVVVGGDGGVYLPLDLYPQIFIVTKLADFSCEE